MMRIVCKPGNPTANARQNGDHAHLVNFLGHMFSSHSFWTSSSLDVPAGVTQEEGHTGFFIHLPSVVSALINVFYFSENSEYFLDLGKMFPRHREKKGHRNLGKNKFPRPRNFLETPGNIGQRN